MRNEQIILNNRVFLMEEGVLKGTGETFEFEDEKGKRVIEVPEEIHTFQVWKLLGFSVKKGEHSVARFPIWNAVKVKGQEKQEDEQADGDGKGKGYYMKVSHFFTRDQVEELRTEKAK